jgi:hypothetical protein
VARVAHLVARVARAKAVTLFSVLVRTRSNYSVSSTRPSTTMLLSKMPGASCVISDMVSDTP